jgi:hypothetical protein
MQANQVIFAVLQLNTQSVHSALLALVFLVFMLVWPVILLLGPVGICIGLAILGAVLATMAADEVRSPLEVWLSDTCFGLKRAEHEKHWDANSLTDLQAAMKAYYTIASGVSAEIRRERMAEVVLNSAGTG